ncbi:MAG: hypothetical protein ACOC1U_07715 [Spirochaetota bacterium]
MTCSTCGEQLQAWFVASMESGEPAGQPPQTVSRHLAVCRPCRVRYEAIRSVLEPERSRAEPPDGLAARITERVVEHAEERDRRRFGRGHGSQRHAPGTPTRSAIPMWSRAAQVASAAAVLAVVLMAGVLLGRALPRSPGEAEPSAPLASPAQPAEHVIRVEFVLEAPGATAVSVVGDWNNWDSGANPLTDRDGDGVWEATITLEPGGEYQYQFLIDDQEWIPDPSSPLRVDDGFGGTNSVLNI